LKIPFEQSEGYTLIQRWMSSKGIAPFSFQRKAWEKYAQGHHGLVVAPTGFGKTYSLFLGVLIDFLNHPEAYGKGLKLLWISPLRSLAKDLARAMQEAIDEIGLDWVVQVRNGDMELKARAQQLKNMPDILVVTPESLHLLLAQKHNDKFFKSLRCVVVDEWHELISNKRGVLVQLALAVFRYRYKKLRIWGISATMGAMDTAMEVLIPGATKRAMVTAKEKKKIDIQAVFPAEVEVLPWAGHLGAKMVDQVVEIVLKSRSTLIFTNTRNQSEMWYQLLLEAYPDFAGQMALHHSSIDAHLRAWVEESLSTGVLKVVVSTSSLDLGVDFRPVDTVIQVGSSKGVARFMQRAGRSGHLPFETSTIYFVPTHSLELIEVAALKEAVKQQVMEEAEPVALPFDVLVQFMVTMALGEGFYREQLLEMVRMSYAFQEITDEEWAWCIQFVTVGGSSLQHYEEYHKVVVKEDGKMVVEKRKIAMLHCMNMGVIVGEVMLKVKFLGGGYIGMVEEYFITKLNKGDKFILAGRVLEYIMIKEMTVMVRSSSGKAIAPSWLGGRLPLTSKLSLFLRQKLAQSLDPKSTEKELRFLHPLIDNQKHHSHIPKENEFLVEYIENREGYHLFFYPFEGRLVHEVMSVLIAHRISKIAPSSFSMAMNDYGFELFSDTPIRIEESDLAVILSEKNLMEDVIASINAAEMARRKFRDIAVIAGLVVQNRPGKKANNRSLQASSGTIFSVFEEHDPYNLLLRQAYTEVFNQQLEEPRLREVFKRISKSTLIFRRSERFTPLSFPIKVDSLRQSLSNEDLATRVRRLQEAAQKKKKRR
jgi:ATP-dependent Lhr-like helicase